MQAIGDDANVIHCPNDDAPGTAQPSSRYAAVRFNALQHGILSRYTVLAHEDANEYQALLSALLEEHQPRAITEAHLVGELAGIIWRKRRVLQAEGASINKGLKSVALDAKGVIPAATPFEVGVSGDGSDLRDLIPLTPDEVSERQRYARHDLAATQKAWAILRREGANAYDKALRALTPDSRACWQEYLDEGEVPATVTELADFIRDGLEPISMRMEREARHHEAIKAQALGEGLQVHRLENLTRYETHLDRKFERTLAMILKMKELRSGR